LRLTRRPWTETAEKGMARLGVLIPSYRLAAATFTELVGLTVAAATLEEVTTAAGRRLLEVEATTAEAAIELPTRADGLRDPTGTEAPAPPPDHLCVSMDGAKVNTLDGWREVKTAAVSEVEPLANPEPDGTRVRLVNHSDRAGFWEAKEFAAEQDAEAKRRGAERAKRLTSVNDGAEWIWAIVLLCYPQALQVVDWWHAVDRLWTVANLVYGQGSELARAWVKARKGELWTGEVAPVIAALDGLNPPSEKTRDEARRLREYVRTHAERMRYQAFRDDGEPVGSGTVESACKNVVGTRLKRGGMRWQVERAEAVLALRCAILSNRWHDAWNSQRKVA
jgi:hypothetical protein